MPGERSWKRAGDQSGLFYSGDFDWMKCLSLYREREEIEKSFKALKNELDILPLNTHSEKTTRGFIFIAFLGLIIRTRLINMMREAEILDKYSVRTSASAIGEIEKNYFGRRTNIRH